MNSVIAGMAAAAAGLTVFGGSVIGMLALSGRLNPDGVRNVPVLNRMIPESDPDMAKSTIAADATAASSGGVTEATMKQEPKSAIQKNRIKRKSLFTLQSIAAPTTKQEIDGFYDKAKRRLAAVERERASLEKRQFELKLREQDLEQRHKTLREFMDSVERKVEELRALRTKFEADITMLRAAEVKNVQRQATQLGAMEPETAARYLTELGPDQEDLAIKLLVSMEVEQAAEILAAIDPKRGARLVSRATKLLREK